MVGAFGEVQVMDLGLAKDLTGRDFPDKAAFCGGAARTHRRHEPNPD
jgi:hypothetical protein